MQVIRKYPVQVFEFEYGEVEVPQGQVVLVAADHGTFVWISQDPDEVATMRLRLIGTGHEFEDEGLAHMGSCITRGGFVWHVYRVY